MGKYEVIGYGVLFVSRRRAEIWTQAGFGAILTGKIHSQRPGARWIISADGCLACEALSTCEAGGSRAIRRTAAISQLEDVSNDRRKTAC